MHQPGVCLMATVYGVQIELSKEFDSIEEATDYALSFPPGVDLTIYTKHNR